MPDTPVTPSELQGGTGSLQLPVTCGPPLPSDHVKPKVWVIFGATGLMGRALVNAALEHGDNVTAVGRLGETSQETMHNWHDNCYGDLCDVRIRDTIDAVLKRAIAHFGAIDVIANCTLYGVIGACEDQSMADVRAQFETNYFGTLHIIQLSLPYFRQRYAAAVASSQTTTHTSGNVPSVGGRYLIFSSTSGALGVPGLGPFGATKYAIEALVESMLYETDAHGIKATLVSPGPLRNDIEKHHTATGRDEQPQPENGQNPSVDRPGPAPKTSLKCSSNTQATTAYGTFVVRKPTEPYAHKNAPAQHAQRIATWLGDKQPVSTVKSAELAWQLGHCRFPPLRILLGSFAIESIRDRSKSITEEIEDWKHLNFEAEVDDDGFAATQEGDHQSQHESGADGKMAHAEDTDHEMDQHNIGHGRDD